MANLLAKITLRGDSSSYNNSSYGIVNGVMFLNYGSGSVVEGGDTYIPDLITSFGGIDNTVDLTGLGGYRSFVQIKLSIFDGGLIKELQSNNITFKGGELEIYIKEEGASSYTLHGVSVIEEADDSGDEINLHGVDVSKEREQNIDLDSWGKFRNNCNILDLHTERLTFVDVMPSSSGDKYVTSVKKIENLQVEFYLEDESYIISSGGYASYNDYLTYLGENTRVIETVDIEGNPDGGFFKVTGYNISSNTIKFNLDGLISGLTETVFIDSNYVESFGTFVRFVEWIETSGDYSKSVDFPQNDGYIEYEDGADIMEAIKSERTQAVVFNNINEVLNLPNNYQGAYFDSSVNGFKVLYTPFDVLSVTPVNSNVNATLGKTSVSLEDMREDATLSQFTLTNTTQSNNTSEIALRVRVKNKYVLEADGGTVFFSITGSVNNTITYLPTGTYKINGLYNTNLKNVSPNFGLYTIVDVSTSGNDVTDNGFYCGSSAVLNLNDDSGLGENAGDTKNNMEPVIDSSTISMVNQEDYTYITITFPVQFGNAPTSGEFYINYFGFEYGRESYKDIPFSVTATNVDKPSDVSQRMIEDYSSFVSSDFTGSVTDEYSVHVQENSDSSVGSKVDDVLSDSPFLMTGLNNGLRRLIDIRVLSQESFGSVVANIDKFENGSFKTRDTSLNDVYNSFRIKYNSPHEGGDDYYCNLILKPDFSGVEIDTNAESGEVDFDNYAILFAEEAQASGSFYGFVNVLDIDLSNWDFVNASTGNQAVTKIAYDLLRILGWRRSEKSMTISLEDYMSNQFYLGDQISYSDLVHTSNIVEYGLASHISIGLDRVSFNVTTTYIDRPTPNIIDEQQGSATIFNEQDGSTRVITE